MGLNVGSTFYSRDAVMTMMTIENLINSGAGEYFKYLTYDKLPEKSGTKTAKWRSFDELNYDEIPTPLTEGVTPDSEELSKTDITAIIYKYGNRVTLTDELTETSEFDMMEKAVEKLTRKAGRELANIVRNEMNNTTSVYRAEGVGADASIDNTLIAADLETLSTTLDEADVPRVTSVLNASTGVSTSPINSSYIMLVPRAAKKALWDISGFTRVENYAKDQRISPNEIGSFADIRFIGVNIFTVQEGAGAAVGATGLRDTGGNIDVYSGYLFGAGAVGITTLTCEGLDVMDQELSKGKGQKMKYLDRKVKGFKVKTKGFEMSDSDPLEQRAHASYKFDVACKVLRDAAIYRVKFGIPT